MDTLDDDEIFDSFLGFLFQTFIQFALHDKLDKKVLSI